MNKLSQRPRRAVFVDWLICGFNDRLPNYFNTSFRGGCLMTILVKPLLFYLFNVKSNKHYAGYWWTIHHQRAESFRTDTYANPRRGSVLWREIWSPRLAVYAKHAHPALALTTRCSETPSTTATPGSCRPVRCMQSTGSPTCKTQGTCCRQGARALYSPPMYITAVNYCSCSHQDRARRSLFAANSRRRKRRFVTNHSRKVLDAHWTKIIFQEDRGTDKVRQFSHFITVSQLISFNYFHFSR